MTQLEIRAKLISDPSLRGEVLIGTKWTKISRVSDNNKMDHDIFLVGIFDSVVWLSELLNCGCEVRFVSKEDEKQS